MTALWTNRPSAARLAVEPLGLTCAPGALLGAVAEQDGPAVLESSALHATRGRYTVMACRPLEVLTLREGVLRDARENVIAGGDDRAIWRALREAFRAVRLENGSRGDPVRYLPGWIGHVGYEVGRHIERLPQRAVRDTSLPDLRLAFYDALLLYDAVERRWRLVELVFDSPPEGAGEGGRALRAVAAEAARAQQGPDGGSPASGRGDLSPPAPPEDTDAGARPAARATANFTPDQYQRAVARCVEYIAAGDIFQVNLSQRFTVADSPAPLAIYRMLRRRNPACYAAYMSFSCGGRPCAVASSSPELFLSVHGGHVVTRPIKGTRPRIGQPAADAAAARELWNSPKDNAELAMIVDLLRNDLGRVCQFGSVRVTEPRRLETHPTVFHLVGTVEGRLREGVGPAELLMAAFPGGSVTGAPKIRSMEIIDELEPVARGIYTGCIGHVGVDGACEWNIAIRTVVCDAGSAHVQVGGGIVADSTPVAEYQETLDKARAMLEAIEEARHE